ncbi:hypothetical protein YC2023_070976 [Brassica napus]
MDVDMLLTDEKRRIRECERLSNFRDHFSEGSVSERLRAPILCFPLGSNRRRWTASR